jgi:hypothetical protein
MAKASQSRPMTTTQCGGVADAISGLILPTMQTTTPKIWHFKKLIKDNFTHGLIWQII